MAEIGKERIGAFPKDNKTYIVKRYGKIRKNPSVSSSVFLVQVTLEDMESRKEKIVEISLPYLIIVKIGSVWKNQQCQERYHASEESSLTPFFKKSFMVACEKDYSFEYYILNKKTGKRHTVTDTLRVDSGDYELLSVFTMLRGKDGETVAIPSLELLVSTYVPQTYSILYKLLTLPVDEIVDKYVKSCSINEQNGEASYRMHPHENHFLSTRIFLAYLACNKKTRQNVSRIKAQLEKHKENRSNPFSYSYVEVLPYHPKCLSIKGTGYYDRKKNRYWVQQINEYMPPNDVIFEYVEDGSSSGSKKKGDSSEIKKNREEITDDIDLIDDTDAGWGAGQKYIRGAIHISFNQKRIVKVRKSDTTYEPGYQSVKKTEAKAAAASPLSGQKDSENIGSVSFSGSDNEEADKKESCAKILMEALYAIEGGKYYLDDSCYRKTAPVYCSLRNEDCDGEPTRRSRWAQKHGQKPRKLLVCEIVRDQDYLYLLDIERRKTEAYSGIAFALNTRLDKQLLDKIKRCISASKGRLNRKENGRSSDKGGTGVFPVKRWDPFRHSREKEMMVRRIKSLIDNF